VLNLPEGARTTTLESKTNFLGGAPVGSVVEGETTPLHVGRRSSVWQTRITNAEGKLLCLVIQTQMTIEAR
jgi:1,4-dihydroxy-2-naphthoyl-CoA hydrolase